MSSKSLIISAPIFLLFIQLVFANYNVTFNGTTGSGLNNASGISIFNTTLYVVDNGSVIVIPSSGGSTTFAVNASIPSDITADSNSFLVILENNTVGVFNNSGALLSELPFDNSTGLSFDGTYFYVQDANGLHQLNATDFATIVTYTAINATRTVPFNNSGFVSTSFDGTKVQLYSANATTAVLQRTSPSTFSNLQGIAVVNISNELNILVANMNNITILNSTLDVVYSFNAVITNSSQPIGLAAADGVLYVTEANKIALFQIALVLINNTNTTSSSHKHDSNSTHHSNSNSTHHSKSESHHHNSTSNHHNSTSNHHKTSNSTEHTSSETSQVSSSYNSIPSSSSSPQRKVPKHFIAIVAGVVGGIVVISVALILIICIRKKKKNIIKYWY